MSGQVEQARPRRGAGGEDSEEWGEKRKRNGTEGGVGQAKYIFFFLKTQAKYMGQLELVKGWWCGPG